jgi:hypothetical protein
MAQDCTPDGITRLNPGEVFVFGSNLAGRHGKGAALQAVRFGAKYGVGVGRAGQTYAIPTKDCQIRTLSISAIAPYIEGVRAVEVFIYFYALMS